MVVDHSNTFSPPLAEPLPGRISRNAPVPVGIKIGLGDAVAVGTGLFVDVGSGGMVAVEVGVLVNVGVGRIACATAMPARSVAVVGGLDVA